MKIGDLLLHSLREPVTIDKQTINRSDKMTYINCSHPQDQIEIRKRRIRDTDCLIRYEEPKAFCTKCKCELPSDETPGREIVTFFFIRQDNRIRAQAIA